MKTALCGAWHVHAEGYLETAREYSEVIGAWDENPEWKRNICNKYNLKAFDSFEELLQSEADAVILCTATNTHPDYLIRLAEAKKDIFTEKVLTLSHEDAVRVANTIKKNNIRFVISFPHKYLSGPRTMKSVVESGELGKVHYVRFHCCHNGSSDAWLPSHFYKKTACGGGAMIDLGAHGMYLIEWLLGIPEEYSSVFSVACPGGANTDHVEDNAITVMRYANGTIAVNETGFVFDNAPMVLEVGGDQGYACYDYLDQNLLKRSKKTNGKTVEVPLEEKMPSPIVQFLTGNILPGCGIEDAVHLTDMMVGAYQNQ